MSRSSRVAVLALGVLMICLAPFASSVWAKSKEKKNDSGRFVLEKEWTFASTEQNWKQIQNSLNKKAPALFVGDWLGGSPGDIAGKIVVVDFWATWCGPCRKAVPETNKLFKSYKDKDVLVLGVCCTREGKGGKMADVAKTLNMEYPTAQDQDNKSATAWGVQWWPYYVVIDRKGMVRAAGLAHDRVDDVIDALLAEDEPVAP